VARLTSAAYAGWQMGEDTSAVENELCEISAQVRRPAAARRRAS
jgi:hypothetical protein